MRSGSDTEVEQYSVSLLSTFFIVCLGSGGRIALYHSTVHTVPSYRGHYNTYGGSASSPSEAGASGTTYIKHIPTDHTTLLVDNNNRIMKVKK